MDGMKKFLIIGNSNAITYKEIFPLIKNNQLWLGFNLVTSFKTTCTKIIDEKKQYEKDGAIYQRFGNICWFTNLDNNKRHEELPLYKSYNSIDYPTYDNYNAIECNKVQNIPYDYDGVIGVPITFLDKYNPNQFELVGCSYEYGDCGKHVMGTIWGTLLNGNVTYKRLFIRKKR